MHSLQWPSCSMIMSSHSSSQSIVSCTKLCIKNNFFLNFMFSASCFSSSTVYCLVSLAGLFLFCWILSLPLSPPAYFHILQQPTPFFTTPTALVNVLFLLLLCIPMPLSIHFLLLTGSSTSFSPASASSLLACLSL